MPPSSDTPDRPRRVLALHTHPGDELVECGGVLARCVREGAEVTVVTATGGETSPVFPDDLRYLQDAPEELADYRAGEEIQALAALGVLDHRFLGGPGARVPGTGVRRYRQTAATSSVEALSEAPCAQVTADVRALLEEVQPDVVLTDGTDLVGTDPDAARLRECLEAAWRDLDPALAPLTMFACERPRSAAARERRQILAQGLRPLERAGSVPDRRISAALDVRPDRAALASALHCARSLFGVHGEFFTDAAGVTRRIPGYTYVREIGGRAHPERGGIARTILTGWVRADAVARPWYLPAGPIASWVTPVVVFLLGMLTGAVGTAVHRMRWYPGGTWGSGVGLPVGLAVMTLAGVCAVLALRLAGHSRRDAVLFAIGLIVSVSVLGLPGAGGSGLILADWMGVAWMYVIPILCLIVAGMPVPRRRHRVR